MLEVGPLVVCKIIFLGGSGLVSGIQFKCYLLTVINFKKEFIFRRVMMFSVRCFRST